MDIEIESHKELDPAIEAFRDYISAQTLAKSINVVEKPQNGTPIDINGTEVNICVKKVIK